MFKIKCIVIYVKAINKNSVLLEVVLCGRRAVYRACAGDCIARFDTIERRRRRRWGALRKRRFTRRFCRPVAMEYPNVT